MTGALISEAQQLHEVPAQNGFFLGVRDVRLQNSVNGIGPDKRHVGAVYHLVRSHLGDEVTDALRREDHGIGQNLVAEIFARVLFVNALRVLADVAGYIGASEVGRDVPAAMRRAYLQTGEAVEGSVEDEA